MLGSWNKWLVQRTEEDEECVSKCKRTVVWKEERGCGSACSWAPVLPHTSSLVLSKRQSWAGPGAPPRLQLGALMSFSGRCHHCRTSALQGPETAPSLFCEQGVPQGSGKQIPLHRGEGAGPWPWAGGSGSKEAVLALVLPQLAGGREAELKEKAPRQGPCLHGTLTFF